MLRTSSASGKLNYNNKLITFRTNRLDNSNDSNKFESLSSKANRKTENRNKYSKFPRSTNSNKYSNNRYYMPESLRTSRKRCNSNKSGKNRSSKLKKFSRMFGNSN